MVRLKGGHTTTDARLDRVPQFDERSRQYGITDDPRFSAALRTRTWAQHLRLNQGREGACPGFSRAHDLGASPVQVRPVDNAFAQKLYEEARRRDEWPGEDYEGSSVLGAIKASVAFGYVGEYRWAFSIDDALGALANVGPVVFGSDWLDGMFDPDANGELHVEGNVAGGHAYCARSVLLPRSGVVRIERTFNDVHKVVKIKTTEPLVGITNSWGEDWGVLGECFVKASGMEKLLKGVDYAGEAAITTKTFAKPK